MMASGSSHSRNISRPARAAARRRSASSEAGSSWPERSRPQCERLKALGMFADRVGQVLAEPLVRIAALHIPEKGDKGRIFERELLQLAQQ